MNNGIQISNLTRDYGATQAVKGIDLSLKQGEIFGLIGPDGAGKTSILRMVCGLLLPDSGKISVYGYDPVTQHARVKDHIGYMPQRFSLYPDLSVLENLRFFADMYLVPKKEFNARLPELMHFSRLEKFRNRKAGALSGGMKQKLALICTLIHTPDVLVLDEPTFGVDPVSRREFWQILKTLADKGLAILVSTAYMDEAQLCDRLALMHQGKFMTQGTPQKVADSFLGKLLDIELKQTESWKLVYSRLHKSKISVQRFGDRLHVGYQSEDDLKEIQEVLQGLPVEMSEIAPSIEDVFVSLMDS